MKYVSIIALLNTMSPSNDVTHYRICAMGLFLSVVIMHIVKIHKGVRGMLVIETLKKGHFVQPASGKNKHHNSLR